jgi:S-DNA-T family DNA segregation ATPase FtsK/SpoIIIE
VTTTALSCPRPPEPPPPHPFPVFASVAPVIASVAIWAVTQSPFALVFALLGPVVALAGLADARRQNRRSMRQERLRFERELVAAIHAIDDAHERESAELRRRAPSAAAILAAADHDPERWRRRLHDELPVTLGVGTVASALELDEAAATPGGQLEPAIEQLRSRAAALERAPIVVDARLGIGLCGPASKTLPALGALVVQLANALPPGSAELRIVSASIPVPGWLSVLPHGRAQEAVRPVQGAGRGEFLELEFRAREEGDAGAVVAIAGDEQGLPRECRVVVQLDGAGRARLIRHPQHRRSEFSAGFVAAREAAEFAARLVAAADQPVQQPDDAGERQLPTAVRLSELRQPPGGGGRTLAACLGTGIAGPAIVDLVAEGPHAVVGGTTGSGKSELLVTWVLAMAAGHGPEEVTFLLVDFKGGAAFAPLRDLPHVVGIVTDLDEVAAARALRSLRAELRHRESLLAERGARSIEELADGVPALARLVIVVDEFAALTAGFPELHEVFADLAARGRSLGVHLVLCTQRPAGSVRDSVLANCTLRISLRVNNRADSIAVVGEPGAAALPRHPVGRAIIARDEGSVLVQLAVADEADGASVLAARDAGDSLRRPWLDPLPARVEPDALAGPSSEAGRGIPFGLLDLPEEQRRSIAVYDPAEQGHLLVIGARRSGKSGALAALATAGAQWVPGSAEGAWDVVTAALGRIRAGAEAGGLLLLDDVDILLGRFPPDYRAAFLEALTALHREGPAAGVHIVSACTSVVAGLAALCEARLVLRMADRQEYAAVMGGIAGFDPSLPPGGGIWNGSRVQVVLAPKPIRPEPPAAAVLDPSTMGEWTSSCLAVVSPTPGPLGDRLAAFGRIVLLADSPSATGLSVEGGERTVILGDPDAWTAAWGLLGTLRSRVPVLFQGCSVAEFRALSRQRELPPPIAAPREGAWLLLPDGRLERVRLPLAAGR